MRYQLRTRIAVAVSLLTLGLLIVAAWGGLAFFERQVKHSTLDHLTQTLQLTTRELQARLFQAQLVMEQLARELPREALGRSEAIQAYLDHHVIASLVFDNGLNYFDRTGRLVAVSPTFPEVLGQDFSFRDYFQVTRDTRYRYISRPFLSRQGHGHPILMFTEPLLDPDGTFLGMLSGSIDLYAENFLGRLVATPLGQDGYFILLDSSDSLVVHPDPARIMESWSEVVPRFISVDLWVRSRGLIEDIELDGVPLTGAFQHLAPGDWTLMALVPTAEILAPIRQARFATLVGLALMSLLTVWLVRRLTIRLTEPLVKLADQVRAHVHEEGRFDGPEDGEFRELGELAASIRSLLNDVVRRRRSLYDQLAFLENLVETIPTPVFYKDAGFRYIGCNRAFLDYIGYSREQIIGRGVYDLYDAEQAEVYYRADRELWERGGEQVYETRIRYADASLRDVIFHKKVFHDSSGVPSGLIGVIFDISERKRWESVLKESESRFRMLVENAADAFYLLDGDGRILDVNRHACLDLGFSREELQQRSIDEVSSDYRKSDFAKTFQHLKRTHQATFENTFLRKDGGSFPAEVRICHVEQDGDLYIALARDISERQRREIELRMALSEARAARAQVDNILRSVADGVIVIDRRKRVGLVNHVAEQMLGVGAAEIAGAPFTRLFPSPELRAQAHQFLNLPRSQSAEFDLHLARSEGTFPRVIQARTSRLVDEEGRFAGVVALLHDVSREREVDRVKSEFISTAAHELRTPLSVVLGYCELLLGGDDFGVFDPEQQKQFLREIFNKGQSLTRIVDDLFDISRIEAGLPLPLVLGSCSLAEIVDDVVQRFSSVSKRHRFEVSIGCTTLLQADSGKLVQVFENLLSNAVKYSPEGGVITVRGEALKEACRVVIEDQGIGMSPEQLERVFDKFYRADSSNTAIGGLGIGMSIVRAIVETHGGQIEVESSPGAGTRVTVTLPFVARPPEKDR